MALIRTLTQMAVRRGEAAPLQELMQLVRAPRTAPLVRHMALNAALNLGRADLAEELLGALFLQGDRSPEWSNAETRLAALVGDREEVAHSLKRAHALFGRRHGKMGLREEGLIRLLAGDHAGAADTFRRWLDAGPERDPYPYCMAATALARAGRAQEAKAARVLARREAGDEAWPTILLDLLEGRLSAEQARTEMETRTPSYEHADHRCEIAWHLAMQAETAGRAADARRLFEEAAAPEGRGNREHEMARAWLSRAPARRPTP